MFQQWSFFINHITNEVVPYCKSGHEYQTSIHSSIWLSTCLPVHPFLPNLSIHLLSISLSVICPFISSSIHSFICQWLSKILRKYNVTILFLVTPSKPLNFTNTTTTFNSVFLSWSPPSSTGGTDLDHYIITVDPLPETGVCPDSQCRVTSTDTILTNLMYGITYNVTIRAVNCAGSGPLETLSLTIVRQGMIMAGKKIAC